MHIHTDSRKKRVNWMLMAARVVWQATTIRCSVVNRRQQRRCPKLSLQLLNRGSGTGIID